MGPGVECSWHRMELGEQYEGWHLTLPASLLIVLLHLVDTVFQNDREAFITS